MLEAVVAPSDALLRAIQEFRLQTADLAVISQDGGVRAQPTGRPAAAWHGRVYENLRNDALDAIPHQIRQRGGAQRKLRRNQYGFSVSGPVVLPKVYNGAGKTFFTLSYEGMRESIGQFRQLTIPTTQERTGDWGHVVDSNGSPLIIYDPATTSANPNYNPVLPVSPSNLQYLRQPFLYNVIPLTQLDPVAQEFLKYYPQPNLSVGPFFQNNYYSVTPETNRANGFILSVDHSFRQKHRVTARLNNSTGLNGSAAIFPTLANPSNPPQEATQRGARLEHVYTASPTNVNNFRAQLDLEKYESQPTLDALGQPFPRINFIGNYQSLGQQNPISRAAFVTFQIADTFASRWRNHRLSIGQEITRNFTNTYQSDFPAGRFDFNAGLTSLPGIINTGHPFASYLLGMASQGQRSVVTSPSYFRWRTYRTLFNDQWQLTPSLTVTLGANLEAFTQRVEKYNRQSTVSLAAINPVNGLPGALAVANSGGLGRAFVPTWIHVEPNIGIAWSVFGDNNTVLRMNYDRRYGDARRNSDQFATQAFNGSPLWLSPNQQLIPAALLREGLIGGRTFPDLRPEAANDTRADYLDPSKRQPMAQNFNFSVQRQLARFLILTVSYNNQHARNQFVGNNAANPNALPLSALAFRDKLNDLDFNRAQRPYPQYQDFNVSNMFPRGSHQNYNWSFDLEKRTSGGLALTFHYNYFSRMDNYSSNVQDFYDLGAAWSRAQFANPHSANVTYIYELPFGPGMRYLNRGGPLSYIFGGWAVNGRSEFWSGVPLRLTSLFNNTGGVIGIQNLYVDDVPGVDPRVEHPSPERWFNAAAFVAPADFTPGSAPRTHPFLNTPGGFNHDLTLNKRFAIDAARSLEFTASLFNATNHANLNNPDTRIGTAQAPNLNAGRIIGSSGGRIVQLGLRLNF